jgi:hypothetical protein
MGEPLSFLSLTLYNLVVLQHIGGFHPAAICGDDLLTICTPQESDDLSEFISDTGMMLSIGKDYRSNKFGIFCEDVVIHQKKVGFQFLDTVKCRLFSSDKTVGKAGPSYSPIIGRGRMLTTATEWLSSKEYKNRCRILYWYFNHRFTIRKKNLPWYLPTNVGGLGLPHTSEMITYPWEGKVIGFIKGAPLTDLLKLHSINAIDRKGGKQTEFSQFWEGLTSITHLDLQTHTVSKIAAPLQYEGDITDIFALQPNKLYKIGRNYSDVAEELLTRDSYGAVIHTLFHDKLALFGVYNLVNLFNHYKRIQKFKGFLRGDLKHQEVTISDWERKVSRIYKGVVPLPYENYSKEVQEYLNPLRFGYIKVEEALRKEFLSGPSLVVRRGN